MKKTTKKLILVVAILLAAAGPLAAQERSPSSPSESLAEALVAACREQAGEFSRYLPEESAAAYRNLPQLEQQELMQPQPQPFQIQVQPLRP